MLKKVKENKKLEIIQKINTFLAFLHYEGYDETTTQILTDIDILNNISKNISDCEIYIEKKKDYCFLIVYFVDKITQKDLGKFRLPNIF